MGGPEPGVGAAGAGGAACAGTLVLFAFRNSLWRIVGATGSLAGIPRVSLLLFICAIPFFLLLFAVETLLRRHGSP